MSRESVIKPLQKLLDRSLQEIHSYQEGKVKLIKTNRPWLDHQGGVLLQSIILIAGASFGGKTTELENLKDSIMDVNLNKDATDYVWLSNSFEMTSLSSTLRDLRKILKKPFKQLLQEPFTDEDSEKVLHYYDRKTDGRFFTNQTPLGPTRLLQELESFIVAHSDKKAVFIDIDHAALIPANNDGKKTAIDDFVEGINNLKLKYSNVVFIILTQLNRDILRRIEPKSNSMAIQRSDIYQSDTMFHIADYIYGLQNPFYFKIEEYRLLNPSRYEHLKERFTEPNKSGKVSLYTEGCIFVEILKDRNATFDELIDLYTIEIKPFDKPEPILNASAPPLFEDDDEAPF